MPEKSMKLIDLRKDQKGIIVSILGGRRVTQKLTDMGLTPNTEFKIEKKGHLCPIEISIRGSKLALGYGIATKILVRVKE